MLATKEYNRMRALTYARRWAFARNPLFNDYSPYGGDCTNFASQVLLAGALVMNETPTFGTRVGEDAAFAAQFVGKTGTIAVTKDGEAVNPHEFLEG